MTDREKLIELLCAAEASYMEAWSEWSEEQKKAVYKDGEGYGFYADHLIANGVTVQKWIPASEPPKKFGKYNVMIKGAKKATVLWYYPNRKTWESELYSTLYPVTHWMPLPEPPKEGE